MSRGKRGGRNLGMRPPLVHAHRQFLLRLLSESSPAYDEVVRTVIAEFPQPNRFWAGVQAVRSVRLLLWNKLATTEPDETVWLTVKGLEAAGLRRPAEVLSTAESRAGDRRAGIVRRSR